MPELPEVETLRRDLEREVSGKRVKTVDVPGRTAVTRQTKKQLASRLEGTKLGSVARRGLMLAVKLDSGELLVIDLGGTGRMRKASAREAMAKDTQVAVSFTQGGQLRLLDDGGEMDVWVATPEELLEGVPILGELGLDPFDEPISWTTFAHLLLRRRMKLRQVLGDPTAVVGIGPVYTDEILHGAGLRHERMSNELSSQEMRRLYRSLVETLHEAAKHRGTTLADGRYTDLAGKRGDHGSELQVYERDGKACYRCRGVVAKARIGGRQVYFCPSCQT